MKGTCEQIPFYFFLKFMMLRWTGGPDFCKNKQRIIRNHIKINSVTEKKRPVYLTEWAGYLGRDKSDRR